MENPAGRSNYTTAAGVWRRRSSRYSWEELAFAKDDAAGSFWPPRSYTCSFCQREFRSAQALGGHMNVHRRDRARNKQAEDHRNHDQSESKRAASCYTLVFSPNPKKSERSCVNFDLASSSSSPSASLSSRVLSLSRKEGISQESSLCPPSFYSSSSSPFVLEHSQNVKKLLCESPILEEDKRGEIERDVSESRCRAKLGLDDNVDLSVSLNLVIHSSLPEACGGGGKEGEIEKSCKRRRRDESISQPFSNPSLSCKNDIVTLSNEEIRDRANPLEDLDLELRLGADPPKVN